MIKYDFLSYQYRFYQIEVLVTHIIILHRAKSAAHNSSRLTGIHTLAGIEHSAESAAHNSSRLTGIHTLAGIEHSAEGAAHNNSPG